ncbi:hypothetical protein B7H20_18350 [Pseudomonas aeruginosa]|uniref:hypothetical protein n=1 Tax=Pseudomonas aeruginosa TaxID=287 RepID=UPI000A0FE12A|nr:hypothetical protein [Pseudomonas aeruginosa]ORL56798.1 hypothetical protein B7H20_18350 [Pseudomonas aeruginosa]
MSIDWSTAPEGATHWEPRSYDFAEGWMRKDGDGWSYWSEGREVWVRGVLTCDVSPEREATFEARPQDTEQIAAEEREKAISEMLGLYNSSYWPMTSKQFCEILFDAGYRRQEEGK